MSDRSKFYLLPAATQWPNLANATFTAAGDVDGDGRQELIALNVSQETVFFCTLSHIRLGELTPLWNPAAHTFDWGQLVVMDTQMGILGQWSFSTSDQFLMADVDGDGADEVFVFHADGRAAMFDWTVQGSGPRAQLVVSNAWFQQSSISGPAGTWKFSGRERFVAADLDADGSQELVVFDAANRLGVLKYDGSAFSLIALSTSSVQPGAGMTPWILFPGDRFHRMHLGGRDCIAAFDGRSWFGLFDWNGSNLQVLWSTGAPLSSDGGAIWQASSTDSLYPVDIDGDGDQEIFLYDGNRSVAVAKWNQSALSMITPIEQQFTNGPWQWSIAPGNQFEVLKLQGAESVAVFNGSSLGNLVWQDGTLQIGISANGTADAPEQWAFRPADRILAANLDGEAIAELFIWDGAGNAAVLKWGVAAVWSAQGWIGAWNLDFVMSAPATPLVPFTGSQLPVYQYMSNYVYPESLGDIRGEYLNTNIKDFGTYGAQLQSATNPPGQGFTDADWAAVQGVLVPELKSVSPTRDLFTNLDTLAGDVQSQQDSDLSYTVQMVNEKIQTNDDTVDYVISQILDALIWGAAVVPEEKGDQMALAIMASLFGGIMGGSSQPQTATYSNFKCMVDQQFLNAVQKNDDNKTAAMSDAGLLAVISQLASQSWYWDPDRSIDIARQTQNANRIAFYQVVIPVRFQIVQFLDNPTSYPYGDAQQEAPWSYWSQPAANGQYNVYLLCYPDTFFHPYAFPTQDLMNDLFQNLSVLQEDFFLGRYGWKNIPQVLNNNDKFAAAIH